MVCSFHDLVHGTQGLYDHWRKSTRPALVELGKWKGLATFLVAVYAFIAVILPLGSIVITSFMVSMSKGLSLDNFGFDAWIPVLENSQYLDCIWRSLGYAFIAATIGTILSLLWLIYRLKRT